MPLEVAATCKLMSPHSFAGSAVNGGLLPNVCISAPPKGVKNLESAEMRENGAGDLSIIARCAWSNQPLARG